MIFERINHYTSHRVNKKLVVYNTFYIVSASVGFKYVFVFEYKNFVYLYLNWKSQKDVFVFYIWSVF